MTATLTDMGVEYVNPEDMSADPAFSRAVVVNNPTKTIAAL
ncbi:hypothetical protein [Nocardia sp. N2S4-5]